MQPEIKYAPVHQSMSNLFYLGDETTESRTDSI